MKREDHFVQLVIAFLLQVVGVGFGTQLSPRGYSYPVSDYLCADVLIGLSMLPVLACLRRGYLAAKVGAVLLCILPSIYLYHSIQRNSPSLIHAWLNS